MSTVVSSAPYRDLVALHQPDSPAAGALRRIAVQLRQRSFDVGGGSIAVMADRPQHGATFLAANLAIIFAAAGSRVILVDCNFQAARQHVLFGIPPSASGLSDLLLGDDKRNGPQFRAAASPVPGLTVIPAGTVPEPELLARVHLTRVMSALARAADVVIFDAGSAPPTAGTMSVISNATATVVVSRRHLSRATELQELEESILGYGGRVGGVVVFDF